MIEFKRKEVESQSFKKTGNWEVILTDPSLNKFNFGQHISNKYISTDIISPYGQKSIMYNTIPNETNLPVIISLGFENIDEGKISSISFKATETFFRNWKVLILDNRNNSEVVISSDTEFYVEPHVEISKLYKMGFVKNKVNGGKSIFELHLYQANH